MLRKLISNHFIEKSCEFAAKGDIECMEQSNKYMRMALIFMSADNRMTTITEQWKNVAQR